MRNPISRIRRWHEQRQTEKRNRAIEQARTERECALSA
jgi:hypothetical protein